MSVTYPFVAAYKRGVMRWSYSGVSVHRHAVVLPPWSGPVPLQPPSSAAALLSSQTELRHVMNLAYFGLTGAAGDWLFCGFAFSDWNTFGNGGGAATPWVDLAAPAYVGWLMNRVSGAQAIVAKKAGGARFTVAALSPIAANVPFELDHRFRGATLTRAASYSCRINGILVAEFDFSHASAPVYSADGDGVTPMYYGTHYDAGGAGRYDDVFSADYLAGPGAHTFPLGA